MEPKREPTALPRISDGDCVCDRMPSVTHDADMGVRNTSCGSTRKKRRWEDRANCTLTASNGSPAPVHSPRAFSAWATWASRWQKWSRARHPKSWPSFGGHPTRCLRARNQGRRSGWRPATLRATRTLLPTPNTEPKGGALRAARSKAATRTLFNSASRSRVHGGSQQQWTTSLPSGCSATTDGGTTIGTANAGRDPHKPDPTRPDPLPVPLPTPLPASPLEASGTILELLRQGYEHRHDAIELLLTGPMRCVLDKVGCRSASVKRHVAEKAVAPVCLSGGAIGARCLARRRASGRVRATRTASTGGSH